MPQEVKTLQATFAVRGTFHCLDADGRVLKEIHLTGNMPLGDLLTQQHTEEEHGDHRSE